MRMVRSSGERTRDVKRRYTIRGGSIPPRAEQQEKSIFCSTFPPLETVQPTERRTQGRQIHTGGSERRAKPFFLAAGKTANKKTFHRRPSRRAKTAALMASMEGIARVQHPPIRQGFFLSFHSYTKLTRSTLPTRPVRIRGLPQFTLRRKGKKNAGLSEGFPGHRSPSQTI